MAGTRPVPGEQLTVPGTDGDPAAAQHAERLRRRPADQLLAARGLFAGPTVQVPVDLYAKVPHGAADRERHTLALRPHTKVSTNTYFGRFPAAYWQRWTTVTEVQVELDCTGTGEITMKASDAIGDPRVITAEHVVDAKDRTVRLVAPVDRFLDGGALWLELVTADAELTVRRVRWTVSSPDQVVPTTIVICTHNRVDDCLTTLSALADDPASLDLVTTVYVVDQGSDPVESRPRFAEVAKALQNKLSYVRQPNLGGSGGFTRGLYEVTEPGAGPAHVLFMDDDVLCEPEVAIRLAAFANRLAEPAIVGGQMLNLLHPSQLHAPAEHADLAKMLPGQVAEDIKPNIDMLATRRNGRATLEEKRLDAGYNGWWCCLIPSAVVDAIGYPLPMFFQWDDVEYSYRARAHGIATVTVPGAGLWHADFHWKDWDEWHRYFNIRNGMITSALHHPFDPKRIAGVLAHDLARYLVGMQYGLAATLIKAVDDFLRGPAVLADGGVAAVGEIRALRAKYPETVMHPATEIPGFRPGQVTEIPAGPEPAVHGLVMLKRVVYQLLGRGPKHVGTVSAGDSAWWHVSLFDTAIVTDNSQEGVRVRRMDRATLLRLSKQGFAVLNRLIKEGGAARDSWRAAADRLGSRESWTRLYGQSR
ncbi:MAG TPA: glycosyltransferase [Pseudonocardiaceae bacterium]|jgi:galactofuranosylgalactofuranosylrhamnosyl-N-acetylglucosaminyl-diphospho-decaprenol beta-1,5/1,6-galactofuranosyltransferase|nr:glycosyltransferase [Pseudonocardiaceae bacterium]